MVRSTSFVEIVNNRETTRLHKLHQPNYKTKLTILLGEINPS